MPRLKIALARGPVVEPFVRGLNGQASAVRHHRVACVDAQIQQCAFKLRGIDLGGPQPCCADNFHGDVGTDRSSDQLFQPENQFVHVERLWIERLPPREREQSLGQGGSALYRFLSCIDVAIDPRLAVGEAALDQRECAADRTQDVVEVMRKAAGQLTDCFHLVRLPESFFDLKELLRALLDPLLKRRIEIIKSGLCLLEIGDIGIGADPFDNLVPAFERHGARNMPTILPVRSAQPEFRLVGFARCKRVRPPLDREGDVVRVNDRRPVFPVELSRPGAGIGVDRLVEPVDFAVRTCRPDLVREGACKHAKVFLAASHFGFCGDTLDMRPGALGHLADQGEFALCPLPRRLVMDCHQGGQLALLHERHADCCRDADCLERSGFLRCDLFKIVIDHER